MEGFTGNQRAKRRSDECDGGDHHGMNIETFPVVAAFTAERASTT
jgi:hypothetical protein